MSDEWRMPPSGGFRHSSFSIHNSSLFSWGPGERGKEGAMHPALRSVVAGGLLALGLAGAAGAQEIRLGSLNDMTGPTSDVGKDAALGIREAVQYVNDTGGINGKRIRLYLYDYGYRVPEAITTYKRFRDFDRGAGVLGWGTGDTEALSPTVGRDRVPYLSHSFAAALTNPKTAPYNFVYGTDYSSNARAAMTVWFEEVWMKDPRFREARSKGEKPRVIMFYMFPPPH